MKTTLLLFALAALLAAPACNRSHSISTSDGKVTVTEKGKDAASMTFTGKNGEKVTLDVNSGKIPADYPSDAPVYKDAKVTLSQTVSEKNARILMLEAKDAADKIAAFYKSGLEAGGWKIENTATMGEISIMTAVKENRQFTVQVTNSGDHRTIHQTVADKQ
jgi:hypothetical protein